MSDKVAEVRLLVSVDVSHDPGFSPVMRLVVSPVYVGEEGWLRNFTDLWGDEPLADLRISAQADYASEDAYGWRVEYAQPYSVDLGRAEVMVKLLRKIQRGLDRMERDLGYAESFGAYVARVGKLLGASRYGWESDNGERSWQYSDNTYRWTDAVGMGLHVSRVVSEFKAAEVSRV